MTRVPRPPALERLLPALSWLRSYRRADATGDLRAGLTVAVLVIPQAMAYAGLAGVPPIAGLYAATISLVVYAVLGTSRFISVGPVAIDSLLTAAAVAPLADGDTGRYVALASLLAVLVGMLQVGAGLLRLGGLVSFLSVPVLSGFTSAAALTIAASQFKDLLGVEVAGTTSTFVDALRGLAPVVDDIDPHAVALGTAVLLALWALRRWAPGVPGPLVVIAVSTAFVALADWGEMVALLGDVPSGLPVPTIPAVGLDDVSALLPAAAAVALISYMESISTGSVFARRTRTRVRPDQELVAVGMANVAAGLFRGLPVAGGFSRGAVNFGAGARTPMSGVIAAAVIVVALFTITPLLEQLPKVALAGVIVAAVAGLVDVRGAVAIGRVRQDDLVALLVTATATLVLGPAMGLGVGVATSLALFLRTSARPHMPELGQVPGQPMYRNVSRHDVLTDPELVVLRVDAPLYFANARGVIDTVGDILGERADVRYVVLDCSAIGDADYTGLELLGELAGDLDAAGVELHLAAARGPVRDLLARTDLGRRLDADGRVHSSVPHAVQALPVRLASTRRTDPAD